MVYGFSFMTTKSDVIVGLVARLQKEGIFTASMKLYEAADVPSLMKQMYGMTSKNDSVKAFFSDPAKARENKVPFHKYIISELLKATEAGASKITLDEVNQMVKGTWGQTTTYGTMRGLAAAGAIDETTKFEEWQFDQRRLKIALDKYVPWGSIPPNTAVGFTSNRKKKPKNWKKNCKANDPAVYA